MSDDKPTSVDELMDMVENREALKRGQGNQIVAIDMLEEQINHLKEFLRHYMAGAEARVERLERTVGIYERALKKIVATVDGPAACDEEWCGEIARAGLELAALEKDEA